MGATYHHLTFKDRCQLYKMQANKDYTQKKMAQELEVHPSTVSREFYRNRDKKFGYCPMLSNFMAKNRLEKKAKSIKWTKEVVAYVIDKLAKKWSPEQISGRAKHDGLFVISHTRIYQFIAEDKASGGHLYKGLRQNKKRRRKYGTGKNNSIIKNKRSIDDRPDVVNNKERFGDWEIDTMVGYNRSQALITVVERLSKKLVASRINHHGARLTAMTTVSSLSPIADFVLSITSDNGVEFAFHQFISKELSSEFFFAHPYSSWERGLNENTNGLLRQYFPKGCNFFAINDKKFKLIIEEVNNRPRKLLGYLTPNEMFEQFASQNCDYIDSG